MTPTNHPSWPIAAPLRQRINRAAHEQGHTHELRLRADWLTKVQAARDAGATFAELNQLIDFMVTGVGGSKSLEPSHLGNRPVSHLDNKTPYGE